MDKGNARIIDMFFIEKRSLIPDKEKERLIERSCEILNAFQNESDAVFKLKSILEDDFGWDLIRYNVTPIGKDGKIVNVIDKYDDEHVFFKIRKAKLLITEDEDS